MGVLLGGTVGLLSFAFALASGFAFFLLGLMCAHVVTRGHPLQPVLLGTVYAFILFLPWFAVPILVAVGLADTNFDLRSRWQLR